MTITNKDAWERATEIRPELVDDNGQLTVTPSGVMFICHSAGEKIKAYASLEAAHRPSVNSDKMVLIDNVTMISPHSTDTSFAVEALAAPVTEYKITNSLGMNKIISSFQLLEPSRAKTSAGKPFSGVVYIEKQNYFPIPSEVYKSDDPPTVFLQKAITLDYRDVEKIVASQGALSDASTQGRYNKWWEKKHSTLLPIKNTDTAYLVVWDTKRKTLKTATPQEREEGNVLEDPSFVNSQAQSEAFSFLLAQQSMKIKVEDFDQWAWNNCFIADTHISNRPNSTYQLLIGIRRAQFDGLEVAEGTTLGKHVLKISYRDLITSTEKVGGFFQDTLSELTKKHAPTLDMRKEAEILKSWVEDIIGLRNQRKPSPLPQNEIEIWFDEGYRIKNLVTALALPDDQGSREKISLLSPPPGKENKLYFPKLERPRTALYLMHIQDMAKTIQGYDSSPSTWIKFLTKYTFDMPTVHVKDGKVPTPKTQATKQIQEAQKKLLGPLTEKDRSSILSEALSPHIKGIFADVKANAYMKLQDPTIKKILFGAIGFKSTTQLYEQVLSKVDMHQLIYLAKLTTDPKRSADLFSNKFEIESLGKKWKNIKWKKDFKLATDGIIPQKTKNAALSLPDTKTVVDITAKAAQTAYWSLQQSLGEVMQEQVKTLLQTIVDWLNGTKAPNTSEDEFKKSSLPDSLSGEKTTEIHNNLENIPGVFPSQLDIPLILTILVNNATPKELISIFEGNGNLKVIEILQDVLLENILMLEDVLTDVYRTEDFLIALGAPFLDDLINSEAAREINKRKNQIYGSFCDDDVETVVNHLLERFPEDIARSQIEKNKIEKERFLNYLNKFQDAVENNFEQFLFGEKFEDILEFGGNDPSNKSMLDMTLNSYFSPVMNMVAIESMNVGAFFLETRAKPQDPDLKVVRYAYAGEGGEADAPKAYTITHDIKHQLEILQKNLQNPENFSWHWNKNPDGSGGDRYSLVMPATEARDTAAIEMSFKGMGHYDLLTEDKGWKKLVWENTEGDPEKEKEAQAAFQNANSSNKNNYMTSIRLYHGPKIEIDFDRYTPISDDVKQLVNTEDIGITPQASAFATFSTDKLSDYIQSSLGNANSFGWWYDEVGDAGTHIAFSRFGDEIKNTLFSYANEKLLEFIALKISTGPFFQKSNLQKFRVDTPTQGLPTAFNDTYESLESQVGNPEAGKPNKKIDDFLSLNSVIEKTRLKKNYFEILKRQGSTLGQERSPIEHALIIESIDLLFSTFVLEVLIAGTPVFSDINISMLSQYKGNLEIFKNVMTKQLSAFGEGVKQQFFNLLTDYITFRQAINIEKLYPQQVPQDLDTGNIDQIMNFVLKEKLLEILPFYQKKAQMALGDAQLEQKDFLDLIPNVYCAPSSKFLSSPSQTTFDATTITAQEGGTPSTTNIFPARLTNNDDIPFNVIAQHGGFVLESYIKTTINPIPDIEPLEKFRNSFVINPLTTIGYLSVDNKKTNLTVVVDPDVITEGEKFSSVATQNFLAIISKKAPNVFTGAYTLYEEPGKWEMNNYKKSDGQYYNKNVYADRLEWNMKLFPNFPEKFQYFPEYDDYLKQIEYGYVRLTDDQVFIKGNGEGVVSPLVFQGIQERIKKYNLETMAEVSLEKHNVGKLFDEFNAQKTIVASAWNKYLEKAHRIDKWYKFYKELVKKNPAPGHAPPGSPYIFERINGGYYNGFPIIKDGEIDYDKRAQVTDRRLWEEWTDFASKFNENLTAAQEKAGDLTFEEYESKLYSWGSHIKGIKEWSFDLQLDEITKDIDILFYPGLEDGLKFYDKRLEEMLVEVSEEKGVSLNEAKNQFALMGEDFVKLRNTYITDRTQLLFRKNLFDSGFPLSVETLEEMNNVSFDEYVNWDAIKEEFLNAFEELTEAQTEMDALEKEVMGYGDGTGATEFASMKELGLGAYIKKILSGVDDEFQQQMDKAFFKPASYYLPELKYGIRLVYYMPQSKDGVDCPAGETQIPAEERLNLALEDFASFAGHASDPPNYRDKILRTTEVSVRQDGYKAVEFNALPLFEIEQSVTDYLGDQQITLDSDKILDNFDPAIKSLKNKLQQTSEYKNLISEIMYFPELINALGLYCAFSISEDLFTNTSLGLFSGTKYNLMQIIQSVLRDQNTIFLDPENKSLDKVKNNFANLKNPTKDPSLTGEVFSDALGAAAIMASKTAIKILKGYVETTDPAIIFGKNVQSLAIAALSTTKKIGETVGTINSTVTTATTAIGSDIADETGATTEEEEVGSTLEVLGDIKEGVDKTMEGVDDALKAVSSTAALSTIVFATGPFPLGPNIFTPITPAGITYLLAATSMEAAEASKKALEEKNNENK